MLYKFLSSEPTLHRVSLDHVLRDVQSAQLSAAFRAYYLLRPLIPLPVRQILQRNREVKVTDAWYLPAQFLQDWTEKVATLTETTPIIHPWPSGRRFAFVLTHDVETETGFRQIERLADIEEELGFRSSWNIVPHKYKVDHGKLRELADRGFEIGIHGYNHDGKLYSSKKVFQERAVAINEALRKYNAVGFRSPMVHRNLLWLQQLEIEYDASCFDIDPFQAMPGGVGSIWPFVTGRFVELPYTLPQDHTLFIALGESDASIWHAKLDFLIAHHGMALMLTHPDYLDTQRLRDIYRRFLESVRERGDYWHALPREVSSWWRSRAESCVAMRPDGGWEIHGPAQREGQIAFLHVNDDKSWMQSADEVRHLHAMPGG